MLHVARDRSGLRRLTEIAVLRPATSGRVQALTAWRFDCGYTDQADELRRMLRHRVPA